MRRGEVGWACLCGRGEGCCLRSRRNWDGIGVYLRGGVVAGATLEIAVVEVVDSMAVVGRDIVAPPLGCAPVPRSWIPV